MHRAWFLAAVLAGAALCWWALRDGDGDRGGGSGLEAAAPERDGPVLRGTGAATPHASVSALVEGTRTLGGTVEDTAGTLLSGIDVVLTRTPEPGFLEEDTASWLLREPSGHDPAAEVIATATTSEEGRFAFRGVDTATGSLCVEARVAPPWYGTAHVVYGPDRDHVVRLVVGRGSPVRLRLVGPDGLGVAGFLSGFRQREDDTFAPCSFRDLATDAAGEVTVHLPDGAFLCHARVPGVGVRAGVLVETPQSRVVVISLGEKGGATAEGTVRDEQGRGVAGALVIVRSGEPPYALASRTARSDAEGRFRLPSLVTGVLESVGVVAEGYVTVANAVQERELLPGTTVRLDIGMVRGGTVEGRVTGPDDRPVGGAFVQATARHAPDRLEGRARTTTDAEGRFRMEHVPVGEGRVEVSATGLYQPGSHSGWYVLDAAVGTVVVDVRMAAGAALTGRAVDDDGRPVEGARVEVRPWAEVEGWWRGTPEARSRTTDGAGRFAFPGLPPSKRWRVTASAGTRIAEPAIVDTRTGGGPPPQVELVLRQAATVAGRVEGLDGETAPRYRVNASTDRGQTVTVPVSAEGTFRIEGLAPGSWRVKAINWEALGISRVRTLELDWGQVEEDVVLERIPAGTISGVVVDLGGEPLASITLRLDISTPSHGDSRTATTNARGRFSFADVPETGYAYTFWIGPQRLPGTVKPGDEDVRLVHPRPEQVRFEGRVFLPDGTPARSGAVLVMEETPAGARHAATRHGVSLPIADGAFGQTLARRAPDSTFTAEVREVFREDGSIVSTLPTGARAIEPGRPVEFRLQEGRELAGVVVDPDGEPVGGVGVTLVPPAASLPTHHKHMETRPDGSFRFSSLESGPHELRLARPPAPWVAPPTTRVEAGDEKVRIVLRRGTSVRGTVRDDAGVPLAGANLQWQGPGHPAVRAQADAEGRFELGPLPPGVQGGLLARPPPGAATPLLPATVPGVRGGTSDIELRLQRGAMLRGTIVLEDGGRPDTVHVYAHAVGAMPPVTQMAMAADDGTFVLGPVPPGRYRLEVQVSAPFISPEAREVTAPVEGLRIEVPRGFTITGTLTGTDTPQRYTVAFTHLTPSGPASIGGGMTAAGQFRVTLAQDVTGLLHVRDTQGGDLFALVANVRPGGPPLEVALQQGLVLEGRMSPAEGAGQPYVYAHAPSGLYVYGKVAADGSFSFRGVPPGTYELVGGSGGTAYGPLTVEAGRRDIVLESR